MVHFMVHTFGMLYKMLLYYQYITEIYQCASPPKSLHGIFAKSLPQYDPGHHSAIELLIFTGY